MSLIWQYSDFVETRLVLHQDMRAGELGKS